MLIEYIVIISLIVLIYYLTISEEIKKKKIKDKGVTKCIRIINIKMVIASIEIFVFVCSNVLKNNWHATHPVIALDLVNKL